MMHNQGHVARQGFGQNPKQTPDIIATLQEVPKIQAITTAVACSHGHHLLSALAVHTSTRRPAIEPDAPFRLEAPKG